MQVRVSGTYADKQLGGQPFVAKVQGATVGDAVAAALGELEQSGLDLANIMTIRAKPTKQSSVKIGSGPTKPKRPLPPGAFGRNRPVADTPAPAAPTTAAAPAKVPNGNPAPAKAK